MKDFDKYIKNELNKSVEDSSPSDYLKNKIDLEINSQGEKGEFKMKKRFVLVAAAALVLSVGVFAAGKITGTISSSSSQYNYTNYTDMAKAEKKSGFDVYAPESLGDYKFDGITMVNMADMDDTGAKLNKRKAIRVTYKNEADDKVLLAIDKRPDNSKTDKQFYHEMRAIKGVQVYYSRLESVILPDEKDATKEELERSKKDPFFNLAVGSDKREEDSSKHLIFDYKGVQYALMAGDDMDVNEFYRMAEEIIK
ncbi:hypothetical protein HMPREF3023_08840 [Peptoniphilus sp. HMSC075B08]|uniref:hypothetical protein n=1 Tax=Peptoniphilus sp. HMSC075B08 TaxID=1739525 RepID=UPI0008A5C79C|nr:hypothetical protein [Peptoniphilus sp. HMSC075B08]OFO61561.1 hypothetical protein HMPREF3023_08840 [Peptoniphilus sp. HMSC075B08]